MQQTRRSRDRVQPHELQHLHGWEERASSQHDHQREESHCSSRYHHYQSLCVIHPAEQIRLIYPLSEEFSFLQTMWKVRKTPEFQASENFQCPMYALLWIRSGLLALECTVVLVCWTNSISCNALEENLQFFLGHAWCDQRVRFIGKNKHELDPNYNSHDALQGPDTLLCHIDSKWAILFSFFLLEVENQKNDSLQELRYPSEKCCKYIFLASSLCLISTSGVGGMH